MKEKVKIEQQDFKRMKVYPNQPIKPQAQAVFQRITPRPSAAPNATDEELIDLDAEMTLIKAILSRG